MTPHARKLGLILGIGFLLCLLLASILARAVSRTSSLLDKIDKQKAGLLLSVSLADQIRPLSAAASITESDESGFQQLTRVSFADDIASKVGIRHLPIVSPQLEKHEGYDRLVCTVQYENLTLQQLVSFLFEAEQIPGITVWEISPLVPTPGKGGKWNATFKLVAFNTQEVERSTTPR